MRLILLALLLPLAAHAQLALSTVATGGAETPLGALLDIGKVAAGDTKDTRIRVRNTGTNSVSITTFSATGAGFIIDRPSIPFAIAPGSVQDSILHFSSNAVASFSANIQVNSISLIVVATTVPAPELTVSGPCTGTTSIDFGRVPRGQSQSCNFTVRNPSIQPMTIATLAVSGSGFQAPQSPQTPFTLTGGRTTTFTVQFTPSSAPFYSGAITLETRSYALTGAGFDPPLPKPILSFDTSSIQSAQQHSLTMRLPAPSPIAASGFVNLAFLPDTTVVSNDPTVIFVAKGTSSLPFSIKPGDTQILIGDQSTAVFQTGTSSGRLRFTLSGVAAGIDGDPTTEIVIAPSAILLDTATATRRAANLDIALIGFDNTYSAGAISFAFFDTSGRALGSALRADFTADFRSYFTKTQAGSIFQVLLSFPVKGDTSGIGSVDVDLTNAAGKSSTQHLAFH